MYLFDFARHVCDSLNINNCSWLHEKCCYYASNYGFFGNLDVKVKEQIVKCSIKWQWKYSQRLVKFCEIRSERAVTEKENNNLEKTSIHEDAKMKAGFSGMQSLSQNNTI